MRKGDNFPIQVLALRRDGFNGPIHISAEGLPEGVTCPGAVIGPDQSSAALIFTTAENAPEWAGTIQIRGTAQVGTPPREVQHAARAGTIVWNAQGNVPGTARVARSIGLSVMKEPAPLQVTTDLFRVQANQSRQILVPVKVARRNGFDGAVALTVDGLPNNTNIQVENKSIEKGQAEGLVRLFVNGNAKVGTYTLSLKSQAQVAYSRNAEAAERAKAQLDEAAKAAQAAAEAAKLTAQQRDAAVQKLAEATESAKKAQAAVAEAEKLLAPVLEAVSKA